MGSCSFLLWSPCLSFAFQVIALRLATLSSVKARKRLPIFVNTPAIAPPPTFGWATLFFLVEAFSVTVGNAEASWDEDVADFKAVQDAFHLPSTRSILSLPLVLQREVVHIHVGSSGYRLYLVALRLFVQIFLEQLHVHRGPDVCRHTTVATLH